MSEDDDALIKKFRKILYENNQAGGSALKGNENAIQAFMEKNSRLIPTPGLLSGGVFCNVVISKLPINLQAITDFAYVSVSSGYVKITLIELENSIRKIFHKNNPNKFHSDFTSALHQVEKWQMFLRFGSSKFDFLERLKNLLPEGFPMMVPKIDYMLIISGSLPAGPAYKAELNNYASHRKMKIWTYEDVIAALPYSTGSKSILTKAGDGYVVKTLGESHSQLLENCVPSTLGIDSDALKKLSSEKKMQLALWLEGKQRKRDPWRAQIMGRHGPYFGVQAANKLMDVFRRSMNCCEWPNCSNRIFQSIQNFKGCFVLHSYEVTERCLLEGSRSYTKLEMRLYCDIHYKDVPLAAGRVSGMIPYPVADSESYKIVEIDSLARPALLRFIVQHCLPGNLGKLGGASKFEELPLYVLVTNWLLTIASMSDFQRGIYLPLIYMADMSTDVCVVNPYGLRSKYFDDGLSPARYSPSLIEDQRLIESVKHEENVDLARWTLRTQDENGVRMNEVLLAVRKNFTLDQLMSMCENWNFKPFEDATAPFVVDLLPLWLEA